MLVRLLDDPSRVTTFTPFGNTVDLIVPGATLPIEAGEEDTPDDDDGAEAILEKRRRTCQHDNKSFFIIFFSSSS